MQSVKQSIQQRKNDTRKKIMLGGLFVKAGLDHFYPNDPATLYGLLLYGRDLLQDSNFAQKFKELGKELMKNN